MALPAAVAGFAVEDWQLGTRPAPMSRSPCCLRLIVAGAVIGVGIVAIENIAWAGSSSGGMRAKPGMKSDFNVGTASDEMCELFEERDPNFCSTCPNCGTCQDFCEKQNHPECQADPHSCDCFEARDSDFCATCAQAGGGTDCAHCEGYCEGPGDNATDAPTQAPLPPTEAPTSAPVPEPTPAPAQPTPVLSN